MAGITTGTLRLSPPARPDRVCLCPRASLPCPLLAPGGTTSPSWPRRARSTPWTAWVRWPSWSAAAVWWAAAAGAAAPAAPAGMHAVSTLPVDLAAPTGPRPQRHHPAAAGFGWSSKPLVEYSGCGLCAAGAWAAHAALRWWVGRRRRSGARPSPPPLLLLPLRLPGATCGPTRSPTSAPTWWVAAARWCWSATRWVGTTRWPPRRAAPTSSGAAPRALRITIYSLSGQGSGREGGCEGGCRRRAQAAGRGEDGRRRSG